MTALYSQVDRLTERRSPRTPFKSGYVCVCVYIACTVVQTLAVGKHGKSSLEGGGGVGGWGEYSKRRGSAPLCPTHPFKVPLL